MHDLAKGQGVSIVVQSSGCSIQRGNYNLAYANELDNLLSLTTRQIMNSGRLSERSARKASLLRWISPSYAFDQIAQALSDDCGR